MTDEFDRGPYSAAPSALGYLYQVRFALLQAIRKLSTGKDFCVSLETIDDVVFESSDNALEILQTKHRISRKANLSDSSVDLWKSLRIWSEITLSRSLPEGSIFFLVTTETAADGSAASYLRSDNSRSPERARDRLNSTAVTSSSKANRPAYDVFKRLSPDEKLNLLQNVFLVDNARQIGHLDNELKESVYVAVRDNQIDSFLQRLEGWWFRRVVLHLLEKDPWPIFREELHSELNDIREQFKQDNLPIDFDLMLKSIDASGFQDKVFVEQLRLIGLTDPRILLAINDYFRAYHQRSRWMREDLLLVGELAKYEATLVREWQIRFERMKQNLGENATEQKLKEDARSLYDWVESGLHPHIRPLVTEPTIARGTYHILSDVPQVGWHAKFEARIKALLQTRGE